MRARVDIPEFESCPGLRRRIVLLRALETLTVGGHMNRGSRPVHSRDQAGPHQHLFPEEPPFHLDDHEQETGEIVVEQQVLYSSDLPVARLHAITGQFVRAAEALAGGSLCRRPNIISHRNGLFKNALPVAFSQVVRNRKSMKQQTVRLLTDALGRAISRLITVTKSGRGGSVPNNLIVFGTAEKSVFQ